jgi:hypothetical protein
MIRPLVSNHCVGLDTGGLVFLVSGQKKIMLLPYQNILNLPKLDHNMVMDFVHRKCISLLSVFYVSVKVACLAAF